MNVRYLCKKRFLNKNDGGYVEVGDIIEVEYTGGRYGRMVRVPKIKDRSNIASKARMKLPPPFIREHLVLYDEIECIDAYSVLRILSNKYTNKSEEIDIIRDLRYYLNNRQKYLKQCETEDTRQEEHTT